MSGAGPSTGWQPPGAAQNTFTPGHAVDPTSTVEISIRYSELEDMDVFSKSDMEKQRLLTTHWSHIFKRNLSCITNLKKDNCYDLMSTIVIMIPHIWRIMTLSDPWSAVLERLLLNKEKDLPDIW